MGGGNEQDVGPDPMPTAFLSYAHRDDEEEDEGRTTRISELRRKLEQRVSCQLGLNFRIFQDRRDLVWGENWEYRINQALGGATFLIVLLSPRFFNSEECRREAGDFLEHEARCGRVDRILPIRYIELEPDRFDHDELAIELVRRQHVDWS